MRYDVWMEGFVITGNTACARYIGSVEANSFKEACDIVCKDNSSYNSEHLTIWGCGLYDNESDARRSFG